jgi:hypothetical protein
MPKLKLLAKGKVRDIYALPDEGDADQLLFVATDRISAFDVTMDNVRLLHEGWEELLTYNAGHSPERRHPNYPIPILVSQARPCHSKPRPHPFTRFIIVFLTLVPDIWRYIVAGIPPFPR